MVELTTPDADGVTVFEGHGTCTTEVDATDCGESGAAPSPAPQAVSSGGECTYEVFMVHLNVRPLVNAPPAVPLVFPPIAYQQAVAPRR